ncbi:tetratricopeptide repeat protein [Arenimonas fontis]|uniref:Tetratricopeptide repeat protein n=1 Tax=Arenimonas fontis TaxID=2608255 RepID=A0A5B2Z7J2_9GAMM|nr:tetratricopeptide repeat protein [Arenimonas fontis]KAA2284156.1 tetratricopeptide repeat protein [Arenimonas fontis]
MPRHRPFPRLSILLLCLSLSWPMQAAERGPLPIGELMAGEFALQEGDLETASQYYLAAALASDDPALAERATRIAQAAGQPEQAARAAARWRELAPESPAMRGLSLLLALQRGDPEQATALAEELLDMPGEQGFATLLGGLREAGGEAAPAALDVLRRLRGHPALPEDLAAWLALAGLARRLGDRELSDRWVEDGMRRFPEDPRARLLQASAQREAGDTGGARATLAGLGDPADLAPDVLRLAANELALLGDPLQAAQWLARGPQDDASYRRRAGWLVQAGDRAGLQALYAEVRAEAAVPPPARRLLLGHLAEALGLWDEAAEWYDGLPIGQARHLALLRRAGVLARLGRHEEGVAGLHELQVDESADGELRRDAYVLESALHEAAGDLPAARRSLDQGLAVFEDDPELLYARALANERADRVEEALADLRRLLQDNPDDARALNAYGYTLADRRGRWQEALPYIERALALDPDSPATLDSMGWVLFRLGRGGEALDYLRRAWEAHKDAEIAAHLGEVLWALGRQAEARAIWEHGRHLDPDNRAIRRVYREFSP